MLNLRPTGSTGREDLAIFPQTVTIDANAGFYYIGARCALVSTLNEAVKLDNAGVRYLRGFKLLASPALSAGTIITAAPCVSSDNEVTYPVITPFELGLSGSDTTKQRNHKFVATVDDLILLQDGDIVVYKVILPKKVSGITLTATLYLF